MRRIAPPLTLGRCTLHRSAFGLNRWLIAAAVGLIGTIQPAVARAEGAVVDAAGEAFFETRIRPLLVEKCWSCHGDEAEGNLRLDSRDRMLEGGDSGPAVVSGDPAASLLVRAVHYADPSYQMPPEGRLSLGQIEALEEWVRRGLPWPGGDGSTSSAAPLRHRLTITQADRDHWAYRPLLRPQLPQESDHVEGTVGSMPVDAFLGEKLAAAGLAPNPPASPRDLVRRVWFDLVGLPPPLEAVLAFERDPSDAAWGEIVERLLASPAHGEHWARHWLDVVRYAQTNGYERDDEKPFVWRYRDWVIAAINADMPFDQFIREQIAGDLEVPRSDSGTIASGFWHLGTWDDEPDDKRLARFDELDDVLSTIGQAFLGTTIGCARCHDHKFDPFSQSDYYSLLGMIQGVRRYERVVLPPPAEAAMFLPIAAGEEWALAAREAEGRPEVTHVLIRGNPATPGKVVSPGLPEVLRTAAAAESTGTAGRRELADWIASPANPLTPRVAANRLWLHHFGRGLVATPNDFGNAAVGPTHPRLLDWLAAELVDSGWSLKHLHRVIVWSRAYRQSSRADRADCLAVDEANQLLWRQNRRRLEAESIRDAFLAAAGRLNLASGGRGFFASVGPDSLAGQSRPGLGWEMSPLDQQARRSIYGYVKRTLLVPELEAFDFTNTTSPVGERAVTTVAPQSLLLLNGDFARTQAAALAEQAVFDLTAAGGGDDPPDEAFIGRLFERVLARRPAAEERAILGTFMARQRQAWSTSTDPVTLRPLVPRALQEGYRRILAPEQILDVAPRGGTASGWRIGGGVWNGSYEGIVNADPGAGPFALVCDPPSVPPPGTLPEGFAPGLMFSDGSVACELYLGDAAEVAAMVIRGVPTGEAHAERATGYELVLLPREGLVELRRVTADGISTLAAASHAFRSDSWLRLRLAVAGEQVTGWIDGIDTPLLEAVDPQPLARAGQAGLRTLGAPLVVRELVITPAGGAAVRVDSKAPLSAMEASGRARRDTSLLILNLNESITVD